MSGNDDQKVELKKMRVPWVAILFAVALLLVIVGKQVGYKLSGKVPVTDTVGMTLAEARQTLTDAGFTVVDSALIGVASDDWRVCDQSPESGRFESGRTIVLMVSPPYVGLPEVVGLTEAEAKQLLVAAGFDTTASLRATNDFYPEGMVVDVANQAGVTFEGATVELIISDGPKKMPDLRGVPSDDARIILNRFRIRVKNVYPEYDPTLPENTVIRTNPGETATLEEARSLGVDIYINRNNR